MGCGCQIDNQSELDTTQLSPLIDDLAGHVQKAMGINSLPAITLKDDEENSQNPLGKTAYYDPNNKVITIYVTGRHPKDVMRSIAHEMVHHSQNERGLFNGIGNVGEQGYAQKDPHLRNMEKEAYLKGNMCFRDWEDGYKNAVMESIYDKQQILRRKTMEIHDWKNKELQRLLMEKFGFGQGKPADDEWSKKQEVVGESGDDCTDENDDEEVVTEGEDNPNQPDSAIEQNLRDAGHTDEEIGKMSKKEKNTKASDYRLDSPQTKRNTKRMTAAAKRDAKLKTEKEAAAKRTKAKKGKQEESMQKTLAEDPDFRDQVRAIFNELLDAEGEVALSDTQEASGDKVVLIQEIKKAQQELAWFEPGSPNWEEQVAHISELGRQLKDIQGAGMKAPKSLEG